MIFWIVLTSMTVVLAVALAVPLIRRFDPPASDHDRIVSVLRDQMSEVDADLSRGMIGQQEADNARQEIERRALAAVKRLPDQPGRSSDRTRLAALAIVTGWLVVGAIGIYAVVGRPDVPSARRGGTIAAVAATPAQTTTSTAQATTAASSPTGSVEEMISALVTRLEENPEDAAGWQMLGWSYFNTERYAQAAEAYAEAVALDPSDPDVWSAYGETLVRSARGMVSHDALIAFDEALARNPEDPRARFFKGMALEQAGDPAAAIEAWLDIVDTAPNDADWLPGVVQRIEELAAAANIDLGGRLAGAPPASGILGTELTMPPVSQSPRGPSEEDVAAAQEMSPEDRNAMIRGMVDGLAARLEAEPDDAQGWARLVTSRMVLNDPEGAMRALDMARSIFAAEPEKLAIVLESARGAGLATD